MSLFADAVGAILSGGVTGLLGSGLQFIGGYFTEKQKNKQALELRKIEMDSMKLEAELALDKSKQEAAAAMAVAEQHSFEKSFETDKATYTPANADPKIGWVLVWVDAIRGVIRPGITLWMCYLLVRLLNDVERVTGGVDNLPVSAREDLANNVVLTVLYISTTCILWWFGSRAPQMLKKK